MHRVRQLVTVEVIRMEIDEKTENGNGGTNRNTWFRIQSIEREPNHKQLDVIRRTLQSDCRRLLCVGWYFHRDLCQSHLIPSNLSPNMIEATDQPRAQHSLLGL